MPFLLLPHVYALAAPASMLGVWTTERKDLIEIYNCETHLCLRIVQVDPSEGHSTDGMNPDPAKRNRALCGLTIGSGFSKTSDTLAEGGTLYDPKTGNTYSGTIKVLDSSTLKLRGYLGISLIGRTENWTRAKKAPSACPSI